MADIRNDQFLHRPGAGRGAITPADPFEVLLYDGSGNPLLVKTPTGETRQALGVAGYGHDGTSWRPVKVNASGQAEVQLTGQNVSKLERRLSLPLSVPAGGSAKINIRANAGELWRINYLRPTIPLVAGATRGTHSLQLLLSDDLPPEGADSSRILTLERQYSSYIALSPELLTDLQRWAIQQVRADAAKGFCLIYTNSTDAAQSTTASLSIYGEVVGRA